MSHKDPEQRLAYHRAWSRANREKVRSYVRPEVKARIQRKHGLTARYGISLSDYQKMFDAQGGLCAICQKPETVKHRGALTPLSVDHSHKTNQVRALLCRKCNSGIGMFLDRPDLLEKARAYLCTHQSK